MTPRWITRPSSARTSDGTSAATISISLSWSASPAVNERLCSTAASASATLRPLRTASERMLAAASCSTFRPIVPAMSLPLPSTGWAAPALVPGAIAAMSADIRMKKPAEAAWAPLGATKITTGVRAPSTAVVMSRVEVISPPAVSSSTITAAAPRRSASWIGVGDQLGRNRVDGRLHRHHQHLAGLPRGLAATSGASRAVRARARRARVRGREGLKGGRIV